MYYTSLVQSVERRFPKPDVVGSIPTGRVYLLLIKIKKITTSSHHNKFEKFKLKKIKFFF